MAEPGKSNLTRRQFERSALAMGVAAVAPGWIKGLSRRGKSEAPEPGVDGPNSLRAHAASRGLLYGAAVIPSLLDVEGIAAGSSRDRYTQLVQAQAGILVAENAMKWAALRPSPDTFDFSQGDRLLRFADLAGQSVRGHNLCWHQGLPSWFKATATRDNARQLLVQHIQIVAGHFRGRLHSWDVVNEAVDPADDRPDGLRRSPWLELVGPPDPEARLTYNDYGIELDTPEQTAKRGQVLLLVRRLRARGVPIHAVGVQSHLQADGPQPGAGLLGFIRECARLGLEVLVTEMDVNTRGISGGPEAQDAAVAQVYRAYLGMVLAEPNVSSALTWGITSAHSWLNETREPWAHRPDGARQRPLPFDDDLKPTAAFWALRAAIDAAPAHGAPRSGAACQLNPECPPASPPASQG